MTKEILVQAKNLNKTYISRMQQLPALTQIDLCIYRGETLGIIGKSGCGKSTLAKVLMNLEELDTGDIKRLNPLKIQMVFQNTLSSLNPAKNVYQLISAPLKGKLSSFKTSKIVNDLMNEVGLSLDLAKRFPNSLSGGQRQRVGIARALVLNPDILICDEAVASLDASVKSHIINLLVRLHTTRNLAVVFISHELPIVRHLCDRILVMNHGKIIEEGMADQIFKAPKHSFTQELLNTSLFLKNTIRKEEND